MDNQHSVRLDLAGELRSGLIKYMAKHDLDKQFAALCLLLKSMRSENLISDEVYQFYFSRYSRPVSANSLIPVHIMTFDEMKNKQKLDEKIRYFAMVLDQWGIHGLDWRNKKLVEAQEWKDKIPLDGQGKNSALLILDLGAEQK